MNNEEKNKIETLLNEAIKLPKGDARYAFTRLLSRLPVEDYNFATSSEGALILSQAMKLRFQFNKEAKAKYIESVKNAEMKNKEIEAKEKLEARMAEINGITEQHVKLIDLDKKIEERQLKEAAEKLAKLMEKKEAEKLAKLKEMQRDERWKYRKPSKKERAISKKMREMKPSEEPSPFTPKSKLEQTFETESMHDIRKIKKKKLTKTPNKKCNWNPSVIEQPKYGFM